MRIKEDEKKRWDKRVSVLFQPNAWCDEPTMKTWIRNDWGNVFTNPATPGSTGKILLAVHRAQQTDGVKALLSKCKTTLVNIPSGLTPYVQVVDMSVNKPFKDKVRFQSENHLSEHLDLYTGGKITASERRILITKWCGEAWHGINADIVQRGFLKCGISTALDGSEDHLVNIEKLPHYRMPTSDEDGDFSLLTSDEDSDEDSNRNSNEDSDQDDDEVDDQDNDEDSDRVNDEDSDRVNDEDSDRDDDESSDCVNDEDSDQDNDEVDDQDNDEDSDRVNDQDSDRDNDEDSDRDDDESSDCVNDEDSDHVKDEYRNGVKRQRCFLDLFI